MGIPAEAAARVLRFSGGWETTAGDWTLLLQGIIEARQEMSGVSMKVES